MYFCYDYCYLSTSAFVSLFDTEIDLEIVNYIHNHAIWGSLCNFSHDMFFPLVIYLGANQIFVLWM